MTREEIVRNLKYTMEKHKNDTVNTFATNISVMCKDILDCLEQESCNDAVSRQIIKEQMLKYGFHAPDMTVTEFVEGLPPTYPEIIKCEDCIHNGSFDTDCPIRWPGKEYCGFAEGKEELDCNSCEYQDEVDGSNCYECVKGIRNNYKAESWDKK